MYVRGLVFRLAMPMEAHNLLTAIPFFDVVLIRQCFHLETAGLARVLNHLYLLDKKQTICRRLKSRWILVEAEGQLHPDGHARGIDNMSGGYAPQYGLQLGGVAAQTLDPEFWLPLALTSSA